MTLMNQTNFYTPEDLLRLPDAVAYELVDGKLVERNMGMDSSRIGAHICRLLWSAVEEPKAGNVFAADASYQCFTDAPDKVRKPDVSVVLRGRFPQDQVPLGHSRIPPDLAVEVISPNDRFYDVEEKVDEYLGAGVRLVWVVSPETRSVYVYRLPPSAGGTVTLLRQHDTITGEDVIPGFSCPVAHFFE
jgi:Uma2 family endonuclease